MFYHRVTNHPAPGKAPELRALLEERVRMRQGEGYPVALARTVYGEPTFAMSFRFDDLAARESAALGRLPDAAIALVDRPGNASLHNVLVAANLDGSAAKYIEVICQDPLPGQGARLQALLAKRVKHQQEAGVRAELTVEIAGTQSQVLSFRRFYESLADYERMRAARTGEEGYADFVAEMTPLISRHANTEILEVLVPFPERE